MLEVNVVEKKMGGKKENKMVIVEGRNINTKQYIYIYNIDDNEIWTKNSSTR